MGHGDVGAGGVEHGVEMGSEVSAPSVVDPLDLGGEGVSRGGVVVVDVRSGDAVLFGDD